MRILLHPLNPGPLDSLNPIYIMKIKLKNILFALLLILIPTSPLYGATVNVLKVNGIVNPVMAEFIKKELAYAYVKKVDAVIIELDTPGGLDLAMRDIIKDIMASEIPVVVYVSPSGARAASAGVFITISAHVAAMTPGTNIGAAHPVSIGTGQKMDETMVKKVENDAVAYIKGIAAKRGRDTKWVEKAVRKSASITAEEALKLKVIDLISPNLDQLLSQINGRKVETITGTKALNTKGAKVFYREMDWRLRVLDTISNPNVAYILMMIGLAGLYFEFSNPGAILPGVMGAISLILAFYSFQTLPVNYAGLLLIIFAIILFVAEIKITSYGVLSLGGIISLTLGSIMLFDAPVPYLRVSLSVLLPTVILISMFFIFAVGLAVKARLSKPISGVEGLIGSEGIAETALEPEGKVFIHGEIWNAVSDGTVKKGDRVRVKAVEGLKVSVEKTEI